MGPPRLTCHKVVKTKGYRYCIVSSLAVRTDTQVITIDSYTGRLLYTAQPGVDLFGSEPEALAALEQPAVLIEYCALVGASVMGGELCLLGACRVKPTMTFPLAQQCFTITSSKWLRIPLLYPFAPFSREERDKLAAFFEFKLDNLHYYSETYDLTHRFPNANAVEEYDEEFVWNHHMRQAFRQSGLGGWCCVLLQGLAEETTTLDPDGVQEPAFLGLVTRRSCLNVGARYISRGLNDMHAASNEYECELLLWTQQRQGPRVAVKWTTFVWVRGTAPVHWKSQMNVGEGDVIIPADPYKGVQHYWGRLQRRYGAVTPFICISLLRRTPGHGETKLGDTFEASAQLVRRTLNVAVEVRHFDWHHKTRNGIYAAVADLWALVARPLRQAGVSAGEVDYDAASGEVVQVRQRTTQRGIVRWNCLDSLDRTNLSNFFAAWQVIAEMFRCLGLNHHRATRDAAPEPPWPCFPLTVEEVKHYYNPDQLSNLAHLFINNGDLCAYLYTASPALHSQYMRAFAVHLPTASPNPVISIVRKFQNFVEDKKRSHQFEILAGLRHAAHFPSAAVVDPDCRLSGDIRTRHLTEFPAFILRDIPSVLPAYVRPERVLLEPCGVAWVVPRDVDCVEVALLLPEYCQLTELALTIRHGPNERSSPGFMDVFVGDHIDTCLMAWQNLQLPRCDDGTQLFYYFPPHISAQRGYQPLYDFAGHAAPPFIKCVCINFHGISPGSCMTLGQIQLFGFLEAPEPYRRSPRAALEEHTGAVLADVLGALDAAETAAGDALLEAEASPAAAPPPNPEAALSPSESEDTVDGLVVAGPLLGVVDLPAVVAPMERPSLERYLSLVQQVAKGPRPNLTFDAALALEHERLLAHISPWERDVQLVLLGKEVACFDANQKVTFREEKVEANLRRKLQTPACSNRDCKKELMPYKIRRKDTCTYCRLTFCKGCMSLTKVGILEFEWGNTPTKVCLHCFNRVVTQKKLLASVGQLSSVQCKPQFRAGALADTTVYQKVYGKAQRAPLLEREYNALASRPYCLTDCVTCTVLRAVPTAAASPAVEAVLLQDAAQLARAHPNCGAPPGLTADAFWFAPPGVSPVELLLALPSLSHVVSVVLLTDPLGYGKLDAPLIDLRIGRTLNDLQPAGRWDLWGDAAAAAGGIEGLTVHEYILDSSALEGGVRIVSLTLHLPNEGDEPEGLAAVDSPFLHVGRVMVMGNPIPLPDMEPDALGGGSARLSGSATASNGSSSPTGSLEPPPTPSPGGEPLPSFAAADRWPVSRQTMPTAAGPLELGPEDQRTYEAAFALGPKPERKLVHAAVVTTKLPEKGFTDGLTLSIHMPSAVSGFRLDKKLYPEDPNMQIRTVRVCLLREEQGDLVAQVVAGDFLTPKLLAPAPLLYEFAEAYTAVSIARFEFLDTYGSDLTREGCTVSLFSQTSKPDSPSLSGERLALHRQYCRGTPAQLALLCREGLKYRRRPRRSSSASRRASSAPPTPLLHPGSSPFAAEDDSGGDTSGSSPLSGGLDSAF